jgi:chromosome segregation ATPase
MTERFTLIECNGNIEDYCTQNVYDGGEDVFELLDLLNSLDDKNEQLKTELINIEVDRDYFKAKASSLEDGYLQLQDREIRLKRENEQLRTALKELKEIGDYQADRIQELSDDNEQLKEEIKDYNDVLARLEEKQQRERTATQKQHQKWSTQAEQQIKELTEKNEKLKSDVLYWRIIAQSLAKKE